MSKNWGNILLVAGSGRNIGKTNFICQLLESVKEQQPIAIKISLHFHNQTEGLKVITENENYQIFEETNKEMKKDSSMFLQNGADRSFYIQAKDEYLKEVFIAMYPFLNVDKPIIIESASLHKYIDGGFFLFIYGKNEIEKPSTKINLRIANLVTESDGKSFSIKPSQIKFEKEWKIKLL